MKKIDKRKSKYMVLGLMSGTSMDGLDCGLFEICLSRKFDFKWTCIDFKSYSYKKDLVDKIKLVVNKSKKDYKDLDLDLAKFFYDICHLFLDGREIDLVCSHGQTIIHEDKIRSVQIGDPQYLYNRLCVPIVHSLRQADINVGGNGAPLMPFLDWLLFKDYKTNVVTVNIGGIANISQICIGDFQNEVVGFDTGPGMCLIDECCDYFWNIPMDVDGSLSKDGRVNLDLLDFLMSNEFISKTPPKSTGRDIFGYKYLDNVFKKFNYIEKVDFLRTLIAFTAKSISKNIKNLNNFTIDDYNFIISGGGVNHPLLMNDLKLFLKSNKIYDSSIIGINPNMKESLLMAVLGVAKINDIPANITNVTGATKNVVLGEIVNE